MVSKPHCQQETKWEKPQSSVAKSLLKKKKNAVKENLESAKMLNVIYVVQI